MGSFKLSINNCDYWREMKRIGGRERNQLDGILRSVKLVITFQAREKQTGWNLNNNNNDNSGEEPREDKQVELCSQWKRIRRRDLSNCLYVPRGGRVMNRFGPSK